MTTKLTTAQVTALKLATGKHGVWNRHHDNKYESPVAALQVLRKLEAMGYVEPINAGSTAKSVQFVATPAGRNIISMLPESILDSELTDADYENYLRGLAAFVDSIIPSPVIDDCFDTNDHNAPFNTVTYEPSKAAPLSTTNPRLLLPALTPSTRNAQYNAQLAARCRAYPTSKPSPAPVIYLPAPAGTVEADRRREAQRQSWIARSMFCACPQPKRSASNGVFRLYVEPLTLTAPDDSFGGFYPLSDKLPDVRVLASGKSGPAFDKTERASWKDSAKVVGGAKFPMGDAAAIAKQYAGR